MKKFTIFLFLILISGGMIFSQTINVQIPNASITWYIGKTYKIVWSSNCYTSRYKINIFKGSIAQSNFMGQIMGEDGATSADWEITEKFTPGKYIVRVKSVDNICSGDSKVFNVQSLAGPAASPSPAAFIKIKIIEPNYYTSFKEGKNNIIKWKDLNPVKKTIKIRLYNDKNQHIYEIKTILALNIKKINIAKERTNNISTTNWFIPKDLFDISGKFIIKITTVNGLVLGTSDKFHIRDADTWDFGDGKKNHN